MADASQIFEHDERGLFAFSYECLGDLMVEVTHPTVFSMAYAVEPFSCAAGLTFLQLGSEGLVLGAFLYHLLPVEEGAYPVAVVADGEEAHAEVHAHDVAGRDRFWNGERDRYVQQPFAVAA